MELFEELGVASIFGLHRSAFTGHAFEMCPPGGCAGKAIVYATKPSRLVCRLATTDGAFRFADRPHEGAAFAAGDPVATVVVKGDSANEVIASLRNGVDQVRRWLLE